MLFKEYIILAQLVLFDRTVLKIVRGCTLGLLTLL